MLTILRFILIYGVVTTALSGYYFTQAITSTHIAKARAEEMRLRQNKTSEFIPDGSVSQS